MSKGIPNRWPTDEELLALAARTGGSVSALARALNRSESTVRRYLDRQGIKDQVHALAGDKIEIPGHTPTEEARHAAKIRERLGRGPASIEELADMLDVGPSRVRAALAELRSEGFRIPEQPDDRHGGIVLEKVPAATINVHPSLLDGEEITVGVISDTHLCSKEHAAEHLELTYDVFADRGIREVWHAGDLVAGRGIYRTQDQDLTHFTFEAQRDHAVEHYPRREGITTRIITGNHDIEGDFGKIGANPVVAVANQREDIDYLGDYSAVIELPNGARAQLVHGRGGGSYAVSYKPQRWVEGLPQGRKPAIAIFGHWHIRGMFEHRGVQLLLAGCYEWQTSLLVRLGLQPAVGFHILTMRLGEDGSLVKITPEWHAFYEGRQALAA